MDDALIERVASVLRNLLLIPGFEHSTFADPDHLARAIIPIAFAAGQRDMREKAAGVARDMASKADCRGCPNMEPNLSLNLLADALEALPVPE